MLGLDTPKPTILKAKSIQKKKHLDSKNTPETTRSNSSSAIMESVNSTNPILS